MTHKPLLIAAIGAALALAACNGGGNTTPPNNNNMPTSMPTGMPTSPSALGNPPYMQLDRLNRPAVNEVFANFAEHDPNNRDTPNDDPRQLKPEIISFMEHVAKRSEAIATVEGAVLTPDVQIADLSGTSLSCIGRPPGTCNNYLGVETGGATQAPKLKPFGGRALTDDIVTISLSTIFGNVIPALGLAPDDGREQDGRADKTFPAGHRPDLTSDHVTYLTAPKHFTTTFPYLGAPH